MIKIPSQTKNVLFAGDWHGTTGQALDAINHAHNNDVDIIIQVGDFGIWEGDHVFLDALERRLAKTGIDLYFIDGNHENFPRLYTYSIDQDTGFRPIREHITHLPRGVRFSIANVRFLALGGAYSVDRAWRTLNESYWLEETVSAQEVDRAINGGQETDFLITHDSPFPAPNPVTDDPISQAQSVQMFGFTAITRANSHRHRLAPVLARTQPYFLIHGHYHAYGIGQFRHPSGKITTVVSLDEGIAPLNRHTIILNMDDIYDEITLDKEFKDGYQPE